MGPVSAGGWVIFTVLATLSLPTRAIAQFKGTASVSGRYEYNSNVFNVASDAANPGGGGGHGDGYYSYAGDLAGNYKFGRQELYATARLANLRYQRFTQLNHTDYSLDSGLRWALGEFLDGHLGVSRTHNQVPFEDLSNQVQALTIATQQTETALVGLKLLSDWRVEASGTTSRNSTPIAQEPNLELLQNSGRGSLKYLGIGGLAAGFTAEYLAGRYSGSNSALNSNFNQRTAGATAQYKLRRTTIDAEVGYTDRSSATGLNNASGLTAHLDFQEQVTPRTSVTVKVERIINSYLPTLGSEVDTDAGFTVDWRASYRLHLLLGYTFTYRDYPAQPGFAPGANRVDYQQDANISMSYQARSWLLIRPYASVLTRNSNAREGDFQSNIVGVTVTAVVLDNSK
jgi:hypothetical protein